MNVSTVTGKYNAAFTAQFKSVGRWLVCVCLDAAAMSLLPANLISLAHSPWRRSSAAVG